MGAGGAIPGIEVAGRVLRVESEAAIDVEPHLQPGPLQRGDGLHTQIEVTGRDSGSLQLATLVG